MNTPREIEAARAGIRLLLAEAARLDIELARDDTGAEYISAMARRAAIVASRAAALVTTLTESLPALVRADCEAHHEAGEAVGRESEREAWTDGLRAGMDCLRPDESHETAADAPH